MDYLRECMNDVENPPIDVMNRNWCVGCGNRGCERAGLNQSAFDKRVRDWRETLFINVPRAAPDDPAYDNIRSRPFTPVGPPRPPKTVVFAPGVIMSDQVRTPLAQPAAFVRKDVILPEDAVDDAQAPALDLEPMASRTEEVSEARIAPPGNTPFEQGMVLGAKTPESRSPPETTSPGTGFGKTFILEDD